MNPEDSVLFEEEEVCHWRTTEEHACLRICFSRRIRSRLDDSRVKRRIVMLERLAAEDTKFTFLTSSSFLGCRLCFVQNTDYTIRISWHERHIPHKVKENVSLFLEGHKIAKTRKAGGLLLPPPKCLQERRMIQGQIQQPQAILLRNSCRVVVKNEKHRRTNMTYQRETWTEEMIKKEESCFFISPFPLHL
jgi:hypothetical protein